jgi:hypothetical protein
MENGGKLLQMGAFWKKNRETAAKIGKSRKKGILEGNMCNWGDESGNGVRLERYSVK